MHLRTDRQVDSLTDGHHADRYIPQTYWMGDKNDGIRGVSIVCCHSDICYMSDLFTRPDKRSSNRWCVKGSSFPANALQISYFKILP